MTGEWIPNGNLHVCPDVGISRETTGEHTRTGTLVALHSNVIGKITSCTGIVVSFPVLLFVVSCFIYLLLLLALFVCHFLFVYFIQCELFFFHSLYSPFVLKFPNFLRPKMFFKYIGLALFLFHPVKHQHLAAPEWILYLTLVKDSWIVFSSRLLFGDKASVSSSHSHDALTQKPAS